MTISEAIDKLNHAKKWSLDADFIKALEMAIKALEAKSPSEIVPIGTKVRVLITNTVFDADDIVEITGYEIEPPEYKCSNDKMYWLLSREEFEPV